MFRRAKTKVPGIDEPVSAAQVVALCKLETAASTLAVQALPAAGETDLSAAEMAARELLQRRVDSRHNAGNAAAEEIRAQLNALPDTKLDPTAQTLSTEVGQAIIGVLQEQSGVIADTLEREQTKGAELAAFRESNKLGARSAEYAESPLRAVALLVAVWLVHGIVDAGFYLQASSSGLLGALLTALAVAGLSVWPAAWAGYFPARALHLKDTIESPERSVWMRRWAVPSLILAACVVLGAALYGAHYREAGIAAGDGEFKESMALVHLLQSPLDLSLASVGLGVLSVLSAFFAFWKSYRGIADVHPGYARHDRRHKEAQADRVDLKSGILGRIDSIRIGQVDRLNDQAIATRASLEAIDRQLMALVVMVGRDVKLDASDVKALEGALLAFRKINLRVRADGVVPAYFGKPIAVDGMTPTVKLDDLPGLIEAAKSTHVARTGEVLSAVDRQLRRIAWVKQNLDLILAVIHEKASKAPLVDSDLATLIAEPTDDPRPAKHMNHPVLIAPTKMQSETKEPAQ